MAGPGYRGEDALHDSRRRWQAWRRQLHIACPSALIGASDFVELAVAAAVSLCGFESGCALATVLAGLIEVPVVLPVVRVVNSSKGTHSTRTVPPGQFRFARRSPWRLLPPILDMIGPPDSHDLMKSRLIDDARRSLYQVVEHMTAERWPTALLAHHKPIARLTNSIGNGPVHNGREMPFDTPHLRPDAQRGQVCR